MKSTPLRNHDRMRRRDGRKRVCFGALSPHHFQRGAEPLLARQSKCRDRLTTCLPAGSAPLHQQPGGDTPGVAAAPVALAGAIMPGVARVIVVLSAHADVLGVGMTAIVGLMLVSPSCATSG